MNYQDYFNGLSSSAGFIAERTENVLRGIDGVVNGVWDDGVKYAEADLITIMRQAWCLQNTIQHFLEYNGGRLEVLEKLYEPPYYPS